MRNLFVKRRAAWTGFGRWLALGALGAILSVAPLARADLDGQQACLDREAGSSCTRSSGEIGSCVAEPSAPGVLTCAPNGAAGGASGAGGQQAGVGAAGYTGTGTGAQGGSVDGPACSLPPGGPNDRGSDGRLLVLSAGVAAAVVVSRRRRGLG